MQQFIPRESHIQVFVLIKKDECKLCSMIFLHFFQFKKKSISPLKTRVHRLHSNGTADMFPWYLKVKGKKGLMGLHGVMGFRNLGLKGAHGKEFNDVKGLMDLLKLVGLEMIKY